MNETDVLKSPGGTTYDLLRLARLRRAAKLDAKETAPMCQTSEERRAKRNEVYQIIQLLGIVAIGGSILLYVGKRDQVIEDLKTIVTGLVERDLNRGEQLGSMKADIQNIKERLRP